MARLQDTENSSKLSPSVFLVPQPCPPWTPSYPALDLATLPFQSPKRMRIYLWGRNFCNYWMQIVIKVVLVDSGAARLGCRQMWWYRCLCRLLVSGGGFSQRYKSHKIHSPHSIQPVGCLHQPFPLCCLSRGTCNVSPHWWPSYFGTFKYHHTILSPLQHRGRCSQLRFWPLLLPSSWRCPDSDPAARTHEPTKPETLLAEVASEHALRLCPPALPETLFFVVSIMLS